jgi:pimeloyl-ACP methyl ester carboxylesterase
MSAAGTAVLVGGVVLLVSGTGILLRSTPRWWRPPELATIALVCLLSIWSLGQAVAATNVPRTRLGSETPADVGLTYRDVEFPATDGVRLSGWYVPSRNGAAIVLLHGAGSTRSNVLDHAAVLARHGYGVLLYDARGHGRSQGRAMDFGWFGDHDVGGAVSFLERQREVDRSRIAAVGLSMGGEQAIGAAASLSAISAVVAEGATVRVAGDKDWLSDEFGLRGQLTESAERLTYTFVDLLTSASPPVTLRSAVVAMRPRPVLLIAAGDEPDESLASRSIQRAAPATVQLWVAPNTSHTGALPTHAEEWEARVIDFLDRSLHTTERDHHP